MKDKKKYRKPSLISHKSKLALALSLWLCTMFFLYWLNYSPIPKSDCETVTATYSHCEIVRGRWADKKGLNLYFSDESAYYIFSGYLGDGLEEKVEAIANGTTLTVTYNIYDGEIIELSAEDEAILSYSEYTKKVEQDRKFSFGLFVLTLALPIISLVSIYKEKTKYD